MAFSISLVVFMHIKSIIGSRHIFWGGGSHSRSAHVTCALFWYLKVLGITVLKLENLIILLIMAFMKYFEKDLLKWHNMNDISYVLMFLIFILQGIFLYKNPLTYHKGG